MLTGNSPGACGTDPSSELAIPECFLELGGDRLCEDGKAKPDLLCYLSSFQRQASAAISMENEAKGCAALSEEEVSLITPPHPPPPTSPKFRFQDKKTPTPWVACGTTSKLGWRFAP